MKRFIKKLIREYFEDDYNFDDFDVFDTPKKLKSNKPDNFKNIVKDLGATKTEGKINSYTFQIGPSKIYFKKTLKPNTIELDLISTDINSRGSGSAKKVMSEFIKVIDKYKTKVELSIVPRDKTTDPKMLEKFYKDFGFINMSDFEMRRN